MLFSWCKFHDSYYLRMRSILAVHLVVDNWQCTPAMQQSKHAKRSRFPNEAMYGWRTDMQSFLHVHVNACDYVCNTVFLSNSLNMQN